MKSIGHNMIMSATALVVSAVLGGCGTSDYERLMDKRIDELKVGSKFNVLSSAVDAPDSPVSLRVPQKNDNNKKSFENLTSAGFENPPLQSSAPADGKPYDQRRIKPNVLELSDLKLTFEGFVEDSKHGKQPYYLYVIVSTRPNRGSIPKQLQADLASKINNATQLTELLAQTPEGGEVKWQTCQATGMQPFYYINPPPADGNPAAAEGKIMQLKGVIQLLFRDDNDALVILIWRWPASLDKSMFQSWVEMVAGCVTVKPRTSAPGAE